MTRTFTMWATEATNIDLALRNGRKKTESRIVRTIPQALKCQILDRLRGERDPT